MRVADLLRDAVNSASPKADAAEALLHEFAACCALSQSLGRRSRTKYEWVGRIRSMSLYKNPHHRFPHPSVIERKHEHLWPDESRRLKHTPVAGLAKRDAFRTLRLKAGEGAPALTSRNNGIVILNPKNLIRPATDSFPPLQCPVPAPVCAIYQLSQRGSASATRFIRHPHFHPPALPASVMPAPCRGH
jgi:hypothetical protein